ncbi:hypothetical protein ACI2IX_11080 [Leifsonia aquatica]|uniref:hypothetical protein n=1 Tax=Leifsonia aquatica TaxID=144185 RepID=UPI00384C11C9
MKDELHGITPTVRVTPAKTATNGWSLSLDGGKHAGTVLTIRADRELDSKSSGNWAACWAAAFSARWGYSAIEIDAPVDVMLGPAVQAHADLYESWGCSRKLSVNAPRRAMTPDEPPSRRATGLFFSGGVDSTYSLWKLLETFDPRDLVLVYSAFSAREAIRTAPQEQRVRAVADAAGVSLIVVRTNIGEAIHQDFSGYWSTRENGEVLAGIAHALCDRVETMFIAATLSGNHLVPLGSHPAADAMLSSTQLKIMNHGTEKTRLEKIQYLLRRNGGVLPAIDVCAFWFARDAVEFVNCGVCEKCVRTLAEVYVLRGGIPGGLFRHSLSIDAIDGLLNLPMNEVTSRYWAEIAMHLSEADPLHAPVLGLLARLETNGA